MSNILLPVMYFQVTMCNNGGCIHVSRSHRSTTDLPHGHNIVLHNLYHHLSSHEDVVYGFVHSMVGVWKIYVICSSCTTRSDDVAMDGSTRQITAYASSNCIVIMIPRILAM